MIPTHTFILVVPVELLPVAQVIAVAMTGNPADADSYRLRLSPSGQEPATYVAAMPSCTDDFLAQTQALLADSTALYAAMQGAITQQQADDFCAGARLFVDDFLGKVANDAGLKIIET